MPGDVTLWPNLTGGEVIDLLGRLRGGLDPAKKEQLLERFDLDPTKKGRTYSKGNRQKVALVAALASDVELLILDEPTAGLDPLMEAEFRRCIEEDRQNGRTVLLGEPHPGRGRGACAIGSASCGRVASSKAGPWPSCAISPGPRFRPRSRQIRRASTGLPGVHNLVVPRTTNSISKVDSKRPEIGEVLSHVAGLGVRSLVSQPPDPRRTLHAPLPRGRRAMKSLVGTGQLVRLILRRERLRLAVWVAVLDPGAGRNRQCLRGALPVGGRA